MFCSKENNTQQIQAAGGYFLFDSYASYAENFDLSLLPNDGEVPLSPQSEYSTIAAAGCGNNNNILQQDYEQQLNTSEYIPATIFHDPIQPMKTEKDWCDTPITSPLGNTLNSQQSILYQQQQFDQQYSYHYPSPLPSPPQDNYLTIFPPSPCPSIELNPYTIKQEYGLLPPSPPDSNGVPSPLCDIKSEPETDTESSINIDTLLKNSLETVAPVKKQTTTLAQDHQLLREYLQDTSFQRKHNLKPLALESLIGGWGTRGDIEPVISLALEHARRDVQATCAALNIPPDPQHWTTEQTYSWLQSTIAQYKLSPIQDMDILFPEDGAALTRLSEDEFVRRWPQAGGTLHAQLEVWKAACMDNVCCSPTPIVQQQTIQTDVHSIGSPLAQQSLTSSPIGSPQQMNNVWSPSQPSQSADVTDDEDEEMPLASVPSPMSVPSPAAGTSVSPAPTDMASSSSSAAVATATSSTATTATTTAPSILPKIGRQGGSHIHLWQFLKELLASPQTHGTAIRWLDRNKGVFRIEDSVRVARLWGRRKNRPAMNYDKLSRSIRQYYKKGIMKKTERSQRLVYQFCHPYCL